MKISIENFRHYTDEMTFDFSDNLTLLNGASGTGKSTICAALTWCLYNKPSTKNKPFDKKKSVTKVCITLETFVITRENPGDLHIKIINPNSEIIELMGENAQKHINLIFGDFLIWNSCSYLGQNTKNPLITASGNDKFKIINSIIQSDENHDKLLTITNDNILKNTKKIEILTEKISFLQQKIENIHEPEITSYKEISKYILSHKIKVKELIKLKTIHDSTEETRQSILKKLKMLLTDETFESIEKQKLMNEKYFEKKEILKELEKLGDIPDDYDSLISSLSTLVENTKRYQQLTKDYDIDEVIEYEEKRKQIICENDNFENINQENAKKYELSKREYDLIQKNNNIKTSEYKLKKQEYDNYTREYQNYKEFQKLSKPEINMDEINDKISELKCRKLDLECPTCKCSLQLVDSQLVLGNHQDTEVQLQKFNRMKTELLYYEKMNEKIKNFDHNIEITLPELILDPVMEIPKQPMILKIRKVPESMEYILNIPKPEKLATVSDINLLKQAKNGNIAEKLRERLKLLGNPVFKEYTNDLNILNQIKKLNEKLNDLPETKNVDDELDKYESQLEKYEKMKTVLEKFEKNKEIQQELDENIQNFNKKSSKLANYKRIKEVTETVWYLTFSDVTSSISRILNDFLETTFNDEIIITLKTQKNLKNQVNFEIKYKNNLLENFSSFSGGELDRISLGLTIALSKIQGSKILILDEVMSSLNEDLRDRCLKQIRKTNMKVIHVCHETIEGCHDSVINL